MLYIAQGGRCGNQLFVYAFARKLQMEYPDEKIVFDFSCLKWGQEKYKNGSYWEDSLSRFNVSDYESIEEGKNLISEYGSSYQKFVFLIWRVINKLIKDKIDNRSVSIRNKLFKWSSKAGIYYLQVGYAPYSLTKQKNKFAWGSFEDPRWFEDIRELLLTEYTPKEKLNPQNKELFAAINDNNSVCVSLRKWSLDIHESDNLANRDICGPDYYKKAIKIILDKVENPLFVVFSDDVEWATEIIKNISGNARVISESGNDDVAEKIRLMSACKHFIISNSTFGWWPQYLGQAPDKIVISPDRWLDSFGDKHPLIQKEWILIPAKNEKEEKGAV